MAITVGSPMSPKLRAWLARPEGLFDLSSEAARPEPLFKDYAELPPLPAPRAGAPLQAPPPPALEEGMLWHHRWDRGDRAWVECPFCGEETSTSIKTLVHYGKSCPRCGSKHLWTGKTQEATPAQRAFAQRTFGKPRPKGGWASTFKGMARRAPAGRAG